MKVCDRCYSRNIDVVVASEDVIFASTDEHHNLCPECTDLVREFIRGEVREPDERMLNQQRAKTG